MFAVNCCLLIRSRKGEQRRRKPSSCSGKRPEIANLCLFPSYVHYGFIVFSLGVAGNWIDIFLNAAADTISGLTSAGKHVVFFVL